MTEQENDVRDALGNAGHPLTAREVSLASGVKLPTTRGILRRMQESGEAARDESDRYTLVDERTELPEVRRSSQGQHDEVVLAAVRSHAGPQGLTIKEVSGLVNLRRRVCENTLWRLETRGGELVSVGRPKRYRPVQEPAELPS